MIWVLDTNILISALIWRGAPRQVFERGFAAGVQFRTSPALLSELRVTLNSTKLLKAQRSRLLNPVDLFDIASAILRSVDAPPLAEPVCRDPDDDAVLACAMAAQADLIVSGDTDLLVLGRFQNIPIVTAAEALMRLA